jgi:hypothetical protein
MWIDAVYAEDFNAIKRRRNAPQRATLLPSSKQKRWRR